MKLYIVHGWAYSLDPWDRTVELLREKGVEVIQLNVPGLTEQSDKVWDIDGYVEWLKGKLADESPIVLGHSNGGRIALHFLKKYPGSIGKLILLSSAGIETDAKKLSAKRQAVGLAAKLLRPLAKIPLLRRIVYRLLKSDYNNAPDNMKKTLQNMLASDKDFSVEDITTPTAILWGKSDTTTPLAMGQKLHKQIKGSTFREFDDWDHSPYRTHPDQLANAIYDAIEEKK
ncbi:MAG: alpha/beta hydrolase [Candidatus Saccharimonadaceae bacterium]